MKITAKKTVLASGVLLALGAPSTHAALVTNVLGPYTWSTDRANFTALSPDGFIFLGTSGTNDLSMYWDGNGYSSSSDYTGPGSAANVTASSTTPFVGQAWALHDIQAFVPGSYSFDTSLGGSYPDEVGIMNVTVGPGQLGMHMLFDWNFHYNLDIFVVLGQNSVFGAGYGTAANTTPCTFTLKNCLWTGKGWVGGNPANAPAGNQVWMLATVDGNGDGVMGIPMAAGGPFGGFNFNFNANMTPESVPEVPLPAALWLFGSGLLGLLGVTLRKKRTRDSMALP